MSEEVSLSYWQPFSTQRDRKQVSARQAQTQCLAFPDSNGRNFLLRPPALGGRGANTPTVPSPLPTRVEASSRVPQNWGVGGQYQDETGVRFSAGMLSAGE